MGSKPVSNVDLGATQMRPDWEVGFAKEQMEQNHGQEEAGMEYTECISEDKD